jgi:hypothetical protein
VPIGDWQFWVVTIIALVGAVWLVRTVLPKRPKPRRTDLTISASTRRHRDST